MPRLLLLLLGLAGLAGGIVYLKFGTLDPCGIVRAEIRQQAVREGQFAQVLAAVVPDNVIHAMIATQYGQLTPARCIALAFAGGARSDGAERSTATQRARKARDGGREWIYAASK